MKALSYNPIGEHLFYHVFMVEILKKNFDYELKTKKNNFTILILVHKMGSIFGSSFP